MWVLSGCMNTSCTGPMAVLGSVSAPPGRSRRGLSATATMRCPKSQPWDAAAGSSPTLPPGHSHKAVSCQDVGVYTPVSVPDRQEAMDFSSRAPRPKGTPFEKPHRGLAGGRAAGLHATHGWQTTGRVSQITPNCGHMPPAGPCQFRAPRMAHILGGGICRAAARKEVCDEHCHQCVQRCAEESCAWK